MTVKAGATESPRAMEKMPRKNLNVEIGSKKSKVRKRGCFSSSSSSSLGQNYRLKRALLVGKKGGSTTPVPLWKMMSSESPSLETDKAFKCPAGRNGEMAKELSVSARKLAAILWEINGVPSLGLRKDGVEDKVSEVGSVGQKRVVELSTKLSSMEQQQQPVSEGTDPLGNWTRRAPLPASSQELRPDCHLGGANYLHNGLLQVYQAKNHVWKHCGRMLGLKNCLKDVYDGLVTSEELLKVLLTHIWRIEQLNPTSLSLVAALEFELSQACSRVYKLIQGQMAKTSRVELLLKQLSDEKSVSRGKEQDRLRGGITGIIGQLEMQKKLRQQTEKQNEKLGKELSQAKASLLRANETLEIEKKAREMVEHVCDELARGVGEDKAKVEELKRQSDKLREEVEKEREMLQLADMIREERVRMKLSEARYLFEEKNALVDELRDELEAYLKSKAGKEQGYHASPGYEKIKVLEKNLRERHPESDYKQEKEEDGVIMMKKEDEEEEDTDDSDLCSIELNLDDLRKSFIWGDAVIKNKSKRNSFDKSKGRNSNLEKIQAKQENLDAFGDNGLLGFTTHTSKQDIEDEMKRYKMIKDLRDHVFSGSRAASSQDLSSPVRNLGKPNLSRNDPDALARQS